MSSPDISQTSMLDLFRTEAECQAQALTAGLLALERDPVAADQLESCMRAAHSLKGAARIVGVAAGVSVTHAMEDCFVAAQEGRITLHQGHIDELLQGVDLLQQMAQTDEQHMGRWETEKLGQVDAFLTALNRVIETNETPTDVTPANADVERFLEDPFTPTVSRTESEAGARGGVIRVTTENLNRLLGLAGESLVESRKLKSFAESLLRLKRYHHDLRRDLTRLREQAPQLSLAA
jgi:two-component system sensor histidine kinase and response regulator WspE